MFITEDAARTRDLSAGQGKFSRAPMYGRKFNVVWLEKTLTARDPGLFSPFLFRVGRWRPSEKITDIDNFEKSHKTQACPAGVFFPLPVAIRGMCGII